MPPCAHRVEPSLTWALVTMRTVRPIARARNAARDVEAARTATAADGLDENALAGITLGPDIALDIRAGLLAVACAAAEAAETNRNSAAARARTGNTAADIKATGTATAAQ